MATRKAGDAMLQAAYKEILQGRDYAVRDAEGGLGPLIDRLQQVGSASLSPGELREVLSYAASARRTAEMPAAQRLGLIENYLSQNVEQGAPIVIPVTGRGGVYGASVIDADRLKSAGLVGPLDQSSEFLFVPGADRRVTHVLEGVPGADMESSIPTLATMSTERARSVYGAARGMGYRPQGGVMEDLEFYNAAPGSGILTRQLARTGAPPFQIVPSRGGPFDVLGMRQGGNTMATVQAPSQPGWLGNPYVARDAGGQLTREQATQKFADLVALKAQDPAWRDAFLGLAGKRVGYYKPGEEHIHLHGLQDWLARNAVVAA